MLGARREQGMEIVGAGSEFPNERVGGREALKSAGGAQSTLTCAPGAALEDTDRQMSLL